MMLTGFDLPLGSVATDRPARPRATLVAPAEKSSAGRPRRGLVYISPRHVLASARLCGAEASVADGTGPAAGAWLLRAACQEARAWQDRLPDMQAVPVTVVVPALRAQAATLLAQTRSALRVSGLPAGLLHLAFGEADLADAGTDLLLLLSALRDLGAGVALDSIDCSPEALRGLRRLPVTALRLPKCLVREVAVSAEARDKVGRAIRVAHALGATTVALGVESPLQRDILADLQCDAAQGALFATALPAAAFRAALAPEEARQGLCP